ncbi:MAG TPA: ribbon-helix-helix domain-containing protein [Bryobacteraceae bacterium]|nr:ribbon-helix-helix domain-containing protein [Bryobacteraceae bacterium]
MRYLLNNTRESRLGMQCHMWYPTHMVKTTVYLESDVVLALRRMADSQGRSQAELIREAIQTHVKKAKRAKLPGIGEFDSGHTDTSERADQLLTRAAKRGGWR